jgi:hypothetical protein
VIDQIVDRIRKNAQPAIACRAKLPLMPVHRQAAGVAASKVIRGPVPMSAFGGKADMDQHSPDVRF